MINPYIFPGLERVMGIANDLDAILSIICRASGVAKEDILSKSRKREVVAARQAYCYYAKQRTNHSLLVIGDLVDRDHATVIHSINKIEDLIDTKDKMTLELIDRVNRLL